MSKSPIALVVQRFGPSVIGGAETYAAQMARHLRQDLGYEVHVYTTCAKSYLTWRNEFTPGEESAEFGKIFRFKSVMPRWPLFGAISRVLQFLAALVANLRLPLTFIRGIEWLWVIAQGPVSPGLLKALKDRQSEYQCAILVTYLYWPTLAALNGLSIKKILVPLAHDEPPLYFEYIKLCLRKADHILSNLEPEAALLRRIIGDDDTISIAGAGVELPEYSDFKGSENAAPYLLYLGRISVGKGIATLLTYMNSPEIKARGLQLKLAGTIEPSIEREMGGDNIEYLGVVDEKSKARLISNAFAVVNPSPLESLSILVIEAMQLKTPVLVNETCAVLNYYCKSTDTCFGFRNFSTFLKAIEHIPMNSDDPAWRGKLLRSQTWVQNNFSWESVMKNYGEAIASAYE